MIRHRQMRHKILRERLLVYIAMHTGGAEGGVVDKDVNATRSSPTCSDEREGRDRVDTGLVKLDGRCRRIEVL